MMSNWRLIQLETYDAFINMAIDEAILTYRIEDEVPNTIRFFRWKPSAVSIGKFQTLQNEVQIENCQKLNIDVVRRITGGGTVYHDSESEITYSVTANKQQLGTQDITSIYQLIYKGLVEALKTLGITADFQEGNGKTCPNLTVNGRKISGSAQTHKNGTVLQHGTLLLDIDLQKMFTLLRVPWAQNCMQVVNIAEKKHTSINTELQRKITTNEVHKALTEGFQTAFNTELEETQLSEKETELAKKLCREKYSTTEWNLHVKTNLSLISSQHAI